MAREGGVVDMKERSEKPSGMGRKNGHGGGKEVREIQRREGYM
jgi:hypothetical protein